MQRSRKERTKKKFLRFYFRTNEAKINKYFLKVFKMLIIEFSVDTIINMHE